MKEVGPQDHEFPDWYRQPNNRSQIGAIWYEEWERDHWVKDVSEAEHPIIPEEQAKVDEYCPRIIDALELRTGKFKDVDDATRERLLSDYEGLVEFKRLYDSTSGEDRTVIIQAVGTLIERTKQHPQLLIDLIYSVTHFEPTEVELITEVEPRIKRLSRTPLATENETLNSVIESYKRWRSSAALTDQRAEQIYQRLRNTPPQTS